MLTQKKAVLALPIQVCTLVYINELTTCTVDNYPEKELWSKGCTKIKISGFLRDFRLFKEVDSRFQIPAHTSRFLMA